MLNLRHFYRWPIYIFFNFRSGQVSICVCGSAIQRLKKVMCNSLCCQPSEWASEVFLDVKLTEWCKMQDIIF